jgi:hypothetical protein
MSNVTEVFLPIIAGFLLILVAGVGVVAGVGDSINELLQRIATALEKESQ